MRSARAATIDEAKTVADELLVTARFRQFGDVELISSVLHTESRMAFDDVGSHYYVHLPVTGRLASHHRGTELVATREAAAVYQPGAGPVRGHWAAGTRSLAVILPRNAVDSALSALLGEQPAADIRFDLAMPTADPHARSWVDFVAQINRQLAAPDGLLSQAAVSAPLAESVVTGFLFAVRHSYSEALARPAPRPRPQAIRTAIELMETDPAVPWTVASLARRCTVGVRTLQSGFQQHQGVSPMAYLRTVRLRRAHDDLRAADPHTDSVAAIARRWGFGHLGRFAAAHEAQYGETPLRTLRSGR
ncbi:MAG TPA: AraC family transcriptional regulator [Pseudonocardiaceae bacterium]|nr:AraC family transcriptional regulator [Pseudonocardiaceae bacterium]